MQDNEYLPHFEENEQERVQKIKDHLKVNDIEYLYKEFDFNDNEIITDASFDDNDQLHIYYIVEPETTYLVTFDEDDQNLREEFTNKEEAIKYAKDNIENYPTIMEITIDNGEYCEDTYMTCAELEDDDEDDGEMILCVDGVTRSEQEYDLWINNLMRAYQEEETDLTPIERRALIEGGYIDDDFIDDEDNEMN